MPASSPASSRLRLLVAAAACCAAASSASPRAADCPLCPPVPSAGALPFFTVARDDSGAPAFSTTGSARFHNRPLYGPWNGALVLTGDLPITHLADDSSIYGGLLLGVAQGGTALWAHEFATIESAFSSGAVSWRASDARLPGLELRAAVYAASAGVGFVLDANISCASGGAGGGELIWAFGCAAASASAVGWAHDPLVNSAALSFSFEPKACHGNTVALGGDNASLTTSFADGKRSVSVALATAAGGAALAQEDATLWQNLSSLLLRSRGPAAAAAAGSALPVPGATLWLRAASLSSRLANNSAVANWTDELLAATFAQADPAQQPVFLADGLGAGAPAVRFDGVSSFLASAAPSVGAASTMLAVFRDDGSTSDCCSGVLFFNSSCNGISTLTAGGAVDDDDGGRAAGGPPIVTTLDYVGSAAYGHANIRGRAVVAASVYTAASAGPSVSYVDGCVQYTAAVGGTPSAGGAMLGRRGTDVPRHFRGVLGEVVVFPRALNASELALMHAYLYAAWPAVAPKRACEQTGPLAVGRRALPAAGAAPARFTWAAVAAAAPAADPLALLAAARARTQQLVARVTSTTPSALVDAALPALSLAVDGLYREQPGAFVHGAMAWDELYLGWRSEYGATCIGAPELVANEGRYFFAQQIQDSPNAQCHSDPAHQYMDEAPDSRFHGRGRIDVAGSIYDMQTQFFAQQIHLWRWTGNATHEALLRPALKLHVEWARACFDADGNGLFSSYTNTWPTDSQFYSGGETWEETAYMYDATLALASMATRAGNASEAAEYSAAAAAIAAAAPQLWVAALGIPASHREEGGLRRLRPDPWLASIFLPIEVALWDAATAAQALAFSEWGLERDVVYCADGSGGSANASCGAVVWNSNWVPAQWSVRQLWSGDNVGLALAYLLTGLPDAGWAVLGGVLRRDMLQSAVPGQSGGANGGTDFNDCVHPTTRALVEGLFGFRPDYIAGVVVVAPSFPSAWPSARFASADVALQFATDLAATASLAVQLTRPAPVLVLRVPLRAGALLAVDVTGAPPGAVITNATLAGFGQSVVVVTITGAGVAGAAVTLRFAGALPCVPDVAASSSAGATLSLPPPPGLALRNFSDPQGAFVPGSVSVASGRLVGTLAADVAGRHALVFGDAVTELGGLPQTIQFKIAIASASPPPPPPSHAALAAASWAYVPLGAAANGDLRNIFAAGAYTSPRPETCAVRLGADGYSAWTFAYWNGPSAPQADFGNVPNLTVAPGVIATPQGAQFALGDISARSGARNAAFVTLYDAYPNATAVPIDAASAAGASGAWVLLAGSTNPMQTRLANAELRFRFADGTVHALELVPPFTYWALSGWGRSGPGDPGTRDSDDYDYSSAAFCLPPTPPPTVQLGAANRAMVYYAPIPPSATLVAVELEALSQEVVVALLAVSIAK